MPEDQETDEEWTWECAICKNTFTSSWDDETEATINIPAASDGEKEICDDCCLRSEEAIATWFDSD